MVKQLVFRKKASGNFITNIANVLTTFVKDNDEAKVEERRAVAEAKRIVDIKAAVKEEEERLAAERAAAEAAAEAAERNSLLAIIAGLEREQAVKTAEKAQAEIAAFNQLTPELQALMQIKI